MAMKGIVPTVMLDPRNSANRNDYAPVVPKQENPNSPRTLPFQAQVGFHENIAFTLGMLAEESKRRDAQVSDLVQKFQNFIEPPTITDHIPLLGSNVAPVGFYPYRKTYPFANERWMLYKVTLIPRGGATFPTYVSFVVEGDSQEAFYLTQALPTLELNMGLFGAQALVFNTGDTTNAGTLQVIWRRLWSIESGHEPI